MADHPQPRLLRVFLGDATPPPRGADAGNGNGASPGAGARSAVTVSEGIDAFLAAVDDRSVRDRRAHPYSRPTARDLRWCLAGHVREALGPMRLDAVRRADVEALVAELADEGVSERRCRAVARAVRALYDDAVARGLAEQNPAAGVVAAETGPDRPAVAPAPRASPWERALSLVLRAATAGLLLLALVFLTESL